MKRLYKWFRKVALAEGVSFLILLGIAMPLKYFADMPMAVTVIGGLHGVLFIAFIVLAYQVQSMGNKPFSWLVKAGIASILPFGTFYMDREWKKEQSSIPA